MAFFDDLETRGSDQRSTENAALLKDILNLAANLDGYKAAFGSLDFSIFKFYNKDKSGVGLSKNFRHRSSAIIFVSRYQYFPLSSGCVPLSFLAHRVLPYPRSCASV